MVEGRVGLYSDTWVCAQEIRMISNDRPKIECPCKGCSGTLLYHSSPYESSWWECNECHFKPGVSQMGSRDIDSV
jgi:hypothetical protein